LGLKARSNHMKPCVHLLFCTAISTAFAAQVEILTGRGARGKGGRTEDKML
jgi:hypothetical protein